MPTDPTPIDALPTAPQRTMAAAAFVAAADAFVAALSTFRTQINALGETTYDNAVEAAASATAAAASELAAAASATVALATGSYIATSTSSLTMAVGAKAVLLAEAGKAFAVDDDVVLINREDPDIRLYGSIPTGGVVGQTLTVNVTSEGIVGSGGPYDNWLVIHAAFAQSGATAAELLAMASAYVAVTPKSFKDALAPYALSDGATVTPDNSLGLDFTWTIGGNRTLAPIINTYPGARGTIEITQDGTGNRVLAVGGSNVWRRQGGLGVLSTAAGAIDELQYEVKAVNGSGVATRIIYDIINSPSAS